MKNIDNLQDKLKEKILKNKKQLKQNIKLVSLMNP
jgi:hypothetical protein